MEQLVEQRSRARLVAALLRRNWVALVADLIMSAAIAIAGLGPYAVGDRLGDDVQSVLWYAQLPLLLLLVAVSNVRLYGSRERQPWEYASFLGRPYFTPESSPFKTWLFGRVNAMHISKLVVFGLASAFFVTVVN